MLERLLIPNFSRRLSGSVAQWIFDGWCVSVHKKSWKFCEKSLRLPTMCIRREFEVSPIVFLYFPSSGKCAWVLIPIGIAGQLLKSLVAIFDAESSRMLVSRFTYRFTRRAQVWFLFWHFKVELRKCHWKWAKLQAKR